MYDIIAPSEMFIYESERNASSACHLIERLIRDKLMFLTFLVYYVNHILLDETLYFTLLIFQKQICHHLLESVDYILKLLNVFEQNISFLSSNIKQVHI